MKRIFLFLIVFFFTQPLAAFVPSSSYVISKWLEHTKGVQTLRIHQQLTLFDRISGTATSTYEEEIRVKRGGRYRRTGTFSNGTIETIIGPQKAVRIVNGKSTVISPAEAYGPTGLFFSLVDSKGFSLLSRQAGISLDNTQFILKEGSVGIQFGTAPSLAVAKENFFPLAANWGNRDYHFTPAPVSRFPVPYPSQIEIVEQGKVVERIDVRRVEANISLGDDLFDLRTIVPSTSKKK